MESLKKLNDALPKFSSLGKIADKPTDNSQIILCNRILIYAGIIMSFGGLLWGSIALYYSLYTAAMIPYAYAVLTFVNFSLLVKYRRRTIARFVQIYLSVFLPFMFQWVLGGFISSGGIMIWSAFGGVMCLFTVTDTRNTIVVYAVSVLLTVFSAYIDNNLSVPNVLQTSEVNPLFFAINFLGVGSGFFVLIRYLLVSKETLATEIANKTFESNKQRDQLNEVLLKSIKNKDQQAKELAIANEEKDTIRQEIDKAKTQFISIVSHELRTPLTSIKGALGLIKGGVLNPERLQSVIDIAYKNTNRLGYLIDDILDIERLNVGKMNFDMKSVNVASLIEEGALSIEHFGNQHEITFACFGTEEPIFVYGDHHRLVQAVTNLLSNAAKFSHIGGKVEVSLARYENNIRVSVKDSGIGIPLNARATIFDRFTQVDSTDQRKKGGSGLGLGIAKMIIEAHDGHIDFSSEVGKGSTFYFDLPMLAVSLT